jgi:hypothetical protein
MTRFQGELGRNSDIDRGGGIYSTTRHAAENASNWEEKRLRWHRLIWRRWSSWDFREEEAALMATLGLDDDMFFFLFAPGCSLRRRKKQFWAGLG